MVSKGKKWGGTPPYNCDICCGEITDLFIDGKTARGSWGILCKKCHQLYGVGLGTGRGQQYEKQNGEWIKTAG